MAVITFDGYRVTNMEYNKNHNFSEPSEGISFNNDLSVDFLLDEDEKAAKIVVSFRAGDLDNDIHPFQVSVEIEGFFTYNTEEDKNEFGFKNILKNNGVAILYPYLRNIVSNLTNIANEFPSYTLPTVNVASMLAEKEEDNNQI